MASRSSPASTQDRHAILSDIRRAGQSPSSERPAMPGARRVDSGRPRACPGRPPPLVASTWTLRSRSPGTWIRSAMMSAVCNRESQVSVAGSGNLAQFGCRSSVGRVGPAGEAKRGSLARSSRAIAAHSRLLRLVDQRHHHPAIGSLIGARRHVSARGAPPSRTCSAALWPSKAAVDWQSLTSIQRPVPTLARATRGRDRLEGIDGR